MSTMTMIAFVAILALATVMSNVIWGERGMLICIGIIVIILGLLVIALGCTFVILVYSGRI